MLSNEELINTKGGISWTAVGIGGAIISFFIGLVDGQIKLKWQNLKNTVFIRNLREKHLIQIRRKD